MRRFLSVQISNLELWSRRYCIYGGEPALLSAGAAHGAGPYPAQAAKKRLHCACVPAELESISSMSEGSFPDGGFLEFIIKTNSTRVGRGARVFYDFRRF